MSSGTPERYRLAFDFHPRELLVAAIAALGLTLAGCGDGGSDSAAAVAPAAQAGAAADVTNRAPTISGTPAASVTGGTTYAFTPTGRDADGDVLTFAITGRPAWARFDAATGQLTGTPTQNDVGSSAPIAITVTDGEATVALAAFTIRVVGTASGSASLMWVPPTENEDGTPLLDLAGYRLYWGTQEGSYANSVTVMNPGITRYVVEDLTPATWHFVMTALNSRGIESEYSNLATQEIQ